jgi:ABC-type multidrug transport system fused ATPase/permease subunit
MSRASPTGQTSRTLAKSWELVDETRRSHLVLLVVLALFASGLEVIGAALMMIVLGLVGSSSDVITLPVLGDVSGYLPGQTDRESTIWAASALGVFFVLRGALVIGQTYVQLRVLHNAGARLAAALLRGYMRAPYVVHLRRESAEVIRNLDQAMKLFVTSVLMPVITLITQVLMVGALLVFLLVTAWMATLLVLVVTVPAVVVLLRMVQPRLKGLGRISHDETRRSIKIAQQVVAGMREVKLHRREGAFVRSFEQSSRLVASTQYLRGAAVHLPRVLIETVLVISMLGLVVLTLFAPVGQTGTVSVIGLFAYVSFRLQPALQQIVAALNNIRFASTVVDGLYTDYKAADHSPFTSTHGSSRGTAGMSRLELKSVDFSYNGDDRYALHGVNLEVHKGESLGVCGPTGSGKSTLVDVIAGLLTPSHGSVECNGVDITEDLGAWYSKIGLVSQSVYLLDGTIRSNIAFGCSPQEIDDERVEEAASLAQLELMLMELPNGLSSEVGERGVRLSGGQRQRIAIARALYLRPELLIFDEGTSALDNTTEAALVRAIDELRGQRTLITVAHRLSTVRRCDRIVFLNRGTIEAQGTFDELVARHAAFTAMATAQG